MKFKKGDRVHYHSIIDEPHDGEVRTCRSDPWQLGHGEWVIKVTGKAGCVSFDALSPAEVEGGYDTLKLI